MISIQKIIAEELAKEEKHPKDNWWVTDLSKCLRGVYYERQGLEPDTPITDRVRRVFKVGKVFEDWITTTLERREDLQLIPQEKLALPEKHLTGRLDLALIDNDSKKVVIVELKTMHSNGFWYREKEGFTALPHHKEQLMLYMYLYGLKHKIDPREIVGIVGYVSKDDLTMMEIITSYQEDIVKEALRKLDILEEAWAKQEPPLFAEDIAFDKVKGKWIVNWTAKYCNYHKRCTGDDDWLTKAEARARELNKTLK